MCLEQVENTYHCQRLKFPVFSTVKVQEFPGTEGYMADECILVSSPWARFLHKFQKDKLGYVEYELHTCFSLS